MTNAEIFSKPGEIVSRFILSLFDMVPSQLDPQIFRMMVVLVSLFIWTQFLRMITAIIRRWLGFEQRRDHR